MTGCFLLEIPMQSLARFFPSRISQGDFPLGTISQCKTCLQTLATNQMIEAFADTGAHSCMFHADFCRSLGIKLTEGIKTNLGGIIGGASAPLYYHQIKILIGSSQIQTMVGFSEALSVAGLLGRMKGSSITSFSIWMVRAVFLSLRSKSSIVFRFAFPPTIGSFSCYFSSSS